MMKRNAYDCGTHGALTRRHFLFGSLAAASTNLLRAHPDSEVASAGVAARSTAKSCIFITLNGAASHLDMFDPKDGPGIQPMPTCALIRAG